MLNQQFVWFLLFAWETQRTAKKEQYYLSIYLSIYLSTTVMLLGNYLHSQYFREITDALDCNRRSWKLSPISVAITKIKLPLAVSISVLQYAYCYHVNLHSSQEPASHALQIGNWVGIPSLPVPQPPLFLEEGQVWPLLFLAFLTSDPGLGGKVCGPLGPILC